MKRRLISPWQNQRDSLRIARSQIFRQVWLRTASEVWSKYALDYGTIIDFFNDTECAIDMPKLGKYGGAQKIWASWQVRQETGQRRCSWLLTLLWMKLRDSVSMRKIGSWLLSKRINILVNSPSLPESESNTGVERSRPLSHGTNHASGSQCLPCLLGASIHLSLVVLRASYLASEVWLTSRHKLGKSSPIQNLWIFRTFEDMNSTILN